MKTWFLIFVLIAVALFSSVTAFAQTYHEVVYLKNGSVIRGVITEQIPSVSLKIQTSDGSIFAYQMDEVEKITKEAVVTPTKTKSRSTYASNNYKLKKGYRGFFDVGYLLGMFDLKEDVIEFSTTHGYQIFPYLFAGLGVAFDYYYGVSHSKYPDVYGQMLEVPMFADIRGTLPCRSICQPFLDFKVGVSVYDGGFYMSPTIGCRFAISRTCGINVSVGNTTQTIIEKLDNKEKAVTFKLGVDF